MSLRPQTVPPVPEETARIARAAFPKGNLYLQIRDEIGTLLTDVDFGEQKKPGEMSRSKNLLW